jgi:hypothetical protein
MQPIPWFVVLLRGFMLVFGFELLRIYLKPINYVLLLDAAGLDATLSLSVHVAV